MSQPAAIPSHVFVSHSHADNEFCRRLVQTLRNAGLNVWYDEQNLSAGYLTSTIERELRQADAFLVVLSPAAVASQWVQSEWYAAWELSREGKIKTFLPIVAQPCEIPLLLRGLYHIDFTTEPAERAETQALKLLGVEARPAARPLAPSQWDERIAFLAHTRGCYCLDWSPNGKFLASGSYDKTVIIWDANTHAKLQTLTGHTQGVNAVRWSPDGRTLASASLGPGIRIWDVASGKQRASLEGHSDGVTDIEWSGDGLSLVSSSSDQYVKLWDVASASCRMTIRGHTAAVTSVDWSPGGRWIGTTGRDATIRIWDAATGAEAEMLTGHQGVAYCVRWSPDGSMLASSGHTTVRLWNFRTMEPIVVCHGHTGYVERVAGGQVANWSPRSRRIRSCVCGARRVVSVSRCWAGTRTGCMASPGRPIAARWRLAGAKTTVLSGYGSHCDTPHG